MKLWRRYKDTAFEWGSDAVPQTDDEFARLLTRTTSVFDRSKPWIADAMADFGYAEILGMRLRADETALASGPAVFTFSDYRADGTMEVTDQRVLFVWLDRPTQMYANIYREHFDLRGLRRLDDWGIALSHHIDSGDHVIHPKIESKDGVANRRALEWRFTLIAQVTAEFDRRKLSEA